MFVSLKRPYSEDNGQWWRSIKNIAGVSSSDSSIVTLANNVASGSLHDLAEMANDFFISVSSPTETPTDQQKKTNWARLSAKLAFEGFR